MSVHSCECAQQSSPTRREGETPVTYLVIVLQLVVAIATAWAALATRSQAKVTEKAFQHGLRTLVHAEWRLDQDCPGQLTIVASISETAGVLTEVRAWSIDLQIVREPDGYISTTHLDGRHLHGDVTADACIEVKYRDPFELAIHKPSGLFAVVEVTLTVSAVGVDDPRVWTMRSNVRREAHGFTISSSRPVPTSLVERKPGVRRRLADQWNKWEAWNDRFRGPQA